MSNQVDQIDHRNHGMNMGIISPLKAIFHRKKTQEITSSGLSQNLQRSLSPKENFFLGNRKDLDYIVIDKQNIPDNFIKLFNLDLESDDIENQVRSIFQRARLLDVNSNSARIVFVDDKIVIFRNEERLVHKDSTGLTQGEKRRFEIVTTFNTFSNIYDAIRSQYYIIQNSEDSQNDCKEYQQELLQLAQEIRVLGIQNIKNGERKRKIENIIKDTEKATNFSTLGANLQNLQNITFKNPIIDSNLLEGAKNKFKNRFSDLQDILGVVNIQFNELENILIEHENILAMFLAQITFTDKDLAFDNYQKGYKRLKDKYGDISPFCTFFNWINKYKLDTVNCAKFIKLIDGIFDTYTKEHNEKLLGEHTEFAGFDEMKDNLSLLENIIIKK